MLRMRAVRRLGLAGPRIEQVAAQPQMGVEGFDIQRRQHFAAFRARRDRQLMFGQMRQFAVQPIMATGAQPLRRIAAVTSLWAEVKLDRQFQMMHAIAVTQQHVQFAKGMSFAADRQVGGDQVDSGGMLHRKLPQPLVIQAQPPRACLRQPLQQAVTVTVELTQPVFEALRVPHPVAACQRMALRPRRDGEHRRGEDHPRQIPHFRMAQLVR